MSSDKNILNDLLSKLLENRLKRLEKRSKEQIKDLNYSKNEYKKQGEILSKIHIRKSVNCKIFKKNTFIDSKKCKTHDFYVGNKRQYYLRKAITPFKPNQYGVNNYMNTTESFNYKKNNKYSYIKSRYREETTKFSRKSRKLFLTPEPHMKKKKKPIKIDKKIINSKDEEENMKNKENINKENINKANIRNINKIEREENNKKRIIISSIDLDEEQITFVLEEKRREDKEMEENANLNYENDDDNFNFEDKEGINNINSDSNINSSCSQNSNENIKQGFTINSIETIKKFGEFINSSDGNEITLLICSFLDQNSKINFLSCSKYLLNQLSYVLDNIYHNILNLHKIDYTNSIEDQINNIKSKYTQEDIDSQNNEFSLSQSSIKALKLLNDDNYNSIFRTKKLEPPLNEILLIYRIFFQLIGKEELVNIESDKKFWQKTRTYILSNNNDETGSFFEKCIPEFDFSPRNIYKIKKLINGKEDKLKPLIYENICKTTGLVIFIIKDSLEYCGVILNNKKTKPKILINYLEYLKGKINKTKEFIDKMKYLN
jgi:hypothetical protein